MAQTLGARILREFARAIPINKHRARRQLPDSLEAETDRSGVFGRTLARDGRVQFGSLGRGNHFLELQTAEDTLWLTVHSGSRALGQTLRSHYVAAAPLRDVVAGFLADSEPTRVSSVISPRWRWCWNASRVGSTHASIT